MTSPAAQMPPTFTAEVLRLARFELERGAGESPAGSNAGPDVRRYLAGCVRAHRLLHLTSGAWCAAFASWCVWQAYRQGTTYDTPRDWIPVAESAGPRPPIGYRAAVAELVADAKATGTWHEMQDASTPLRGDLLVMRRGDGDPRTGGEGHVEIVEDETPDGWVTIGGNVGDRVQRMARTPADVVGWIRIGG